MKCAMELAKEREVLSKRYKSWLSQTNADNLEYSEDFVASSEVHTLKEELHTILGEEINRNDYLGSYSSFIVSPLSQGKFQFDLWNHNQLDIRHDWSSLKRDVQLYGTRNSLLVSPMPTASPAQILGNYECFEPIMSNIYSRRVIS